MNAPDSFDDELDIAGWHAWRRGGVGGSDVAALLGLSHWASPTSLYYEKLGLLDNERETDSARQRIGKRMEMVLAIEFTDHTGLYVAGAQTWCQHGSHPWARCTVDGFVADSPYGSTGIAGELALGTVQMKTDGRFGWPDGVPANIRAQCIWEMGVTGLAHCWLIVMFAGFRVEVFEIPWDDGARSDWEYMLAVARTFWFDHVMVAEPPDLDDSEVTTETLTRLYGPDSAGMVDADAEGRALVLEAQLAAEARAGAEAHEDVCRNRLRAYLGDHTDLIDGWTEPGPRGGKSRPIVLASWRPQNGSKIDVAALRAGAPEVAARFSTPTATRVLRVPSRKEPAK